MVKYDKMSHWVIFDFILFKTPSYSKFGAPILKHYRVMLILNLRVFGTVDSCYYVPLGKQEKVCFNEMFIIKRCFY